MSYTPADEWFHQPPAEVPERWQENTFWIAFDAECHTGVLVHTKRCPAYDLHEAHLVVVVDGEVGSAIVRHPCRRDLDVGAELPELGLTPVEPFRHWHLAINASARPGRGPFGFVATHPGGDTHIAADVHLESELAVADWKAGLEAISDGLAHGGGDTQMPPQDHYEQGGRWHGTLQLGDRRVETSGLFVRDHSWGVRVEQAFHSVFWTATALDDGNVFGNAIGFPQPGGTIGAGLRVTRHGTDVTSTVDASFLPAPGILSYDRSVVTYGFEPPLVVEGRTGIHLPLYLPYSGTNRYDNNAISAVTAGGKRGMAVMEWASTFGAEQASELDRAAGHSPLPR